jgi:hypothetical protein
VYGRSNPSSEASRFPTLLQEDAHALFGSLHWYRPVPRLRTFRRYGFGDGTDRFQNAYEKFSFADEAFFAGYRVRMSTCASFVEFLVSGAGASMHGLSPAFARTARVQNVVFVHGLYADGSCWLEVIARLMSAGTEVHISAKSTMQLCGQCRDG